MASDIEHQSPAQALDPSSHSHDHENPVQARISFFSSFLMGVKFKAFRLLAFIYAIAYVLLYIIFYPLAPLLAVFMFSCCVDRIVDAKEVSSAAAEGIKGIYKQSQRKHTLVHIRMGVLKLLARASLLLLVWLSLNLSVPMFKRLTLMGSPLWRWCLLALLITSGLFVSLVVYTTLPMFIGFKMMFTSLTMQTRTEAASEPKWPLGYVYAGLMFVTSFVIYFGLILLSWLLYFRTEHGLKNDSYPNPEAFKYVTWTCVSLFVGSVLWLLKTVFLLKWSANAIYARFEPRILITGVKFFYLCIFIGSFYRKYVIDDLKVLEEYARQSDQTKFNFTNYIMSRKLGMISLESIGQSLTSLAALVRSQEDDGVPSVVEFFQHKIIQTDDRCDLDNLFELLCCTDQPDLFPSDDYRKQTASVLYGIVREQCASDNFTFDDLKKWMVDAHKNCVNMGRTLADANAIVTRLDIFMSFIVVIAVVLLWLLITGVATTQVLVTIATPLLAFTFLFGDSAKTFFQGIIFCFGTHPFDVGDLCILDETELEVKSITILTTTFIKIGTAEKRVYPNSVLATKAIDNLGWQPKPTDVVELTLDYSTCTPKTLQMLEDKIAHFFSDPQQKGSFDQKHEVMMKEIGERVKLTVHFKHVLNIKEMTHGQCVQKKNRQRSQFLKKIYSFLDEIIANRNSRSPGHDQNGGQLELIEAGSDPDQCFNCGAIYV